MQLKSWLLAGHDIVKPDPAVGDGGDNVGLPNPVFTGIIVVVRVEVIVVDVLMQLWFGYCRNLPENQPQGSWSTGGQKGIVVVEMVLVVVIDVDNVVGVVVEMGMVVVAIIFAVASMPTELAETDATIKSNTTTDNSAGSLNSVPNSTPYHISYLFLLNGFLFLNAVFFFLKLFLLELFLVTLYSKAQTTTESRTIATIR